MTNDLIGALHPLISEYRALRDGHEATLAPFHDEDGGVPEENLRAYDEERVTTALEAADALDTLLDRLTGMVGPPLPGTPHTLTYAGLERHDGEAPRSFVVCAEDLDHARRILVALPFYREWFEAQRVSEDGEPADVLPMPRLTHPGVPEFATWEELRGEQAEHQAALDADARDVAADDDLHAVLRDALRHWFADHHTPIPATVRIRAEREDGGWRMWLQPEHATLRYPDGTTIRTRAEFQRTAVADALAEINEDTPAADDGLTVRLLPEDDTKPGRDDGPALPTA